MCHTTGGDTKNYSLKLKSVAHKPAGSPHLRASQDLLPGAPTKRGAAYLPDLERPTFARENSTVGETTKIYARTWSRTSTTQYEDHSGRRRRLR